MNDQSIRENKVLYSGNRRPLMGGPRPFLPLVLLIASLLPVSSPFAQDNSSSCDPASNTYCVPSDCENECRRQYIALSELDQDTSQRYIEQAFGVPFKEASRASLQITMYRGVYAALFVVSDRRKKDRIAFAVTARDLNPNQAKFVPTPFLFLEKRNLIDVTMKEALQSCEGAVKFADIHSGFAWTPPCYFGNPGGHLDYSFYLDMDGANCDKSVHEDVPRFEKLQCKSLENPAVGMFVMLKEDTSKNHAGFNKILGTAAEFICPMC